MNLFRIKIRSKLIESLHLKVIESLLVFQLHTKRFTGILKPMNFLFEHAEPL